MATRIGRLFECDFPRRGPPRAYIAYLTAGDPSVQRILRWSPLSSEAAPI